MIIKSVRLLNFRNVKLSQAQLTQESIWIYGQNAQGKTNLLEALALLHAVRSFRTSKLPPLIKTGENLAQVLYKIEHEVFGECEVLLEISPTKRRIFIDSIEQKTLGEYIGKFPIMAISNDDIKLVRSVPLERRKFIDMLISSVNKEYFVALKNYHKALSQRNKLLKEARINDDILDAFEFEMAKNAVQINSIRTTELNVLGEIVSEKYSILANKNEVAKICLKPNFAYNSKDEYLQAWKNQREKDKIFKSTYSGPHKDDFSIFISDKNAKDFASEGQQRSLALSLKLAEFETLKKRQNTLPVLLCDDILGELDSFRRMAFWECIDSQVQVIASSTSLPESNSTKRETWKLIKTISGEYFCD